MYSYNDLSYVYILDIILDKNFKQQIKINKIYLKGKRRSFKKRNLCL